MMRRRILSLAVLSASSVLITSVPAHAAPSSYEAAVLANNPYVYFRAQETGGVNGSLKDVLANDTSLNNRDGVYRGTVDGPPTGGAAGAGTGSDTAAVFPDPALAGLHYLRTTDSRSFGTQSGQSSYEFIFKANVADMGTQQALFGIFNAAVPAEVPDDPATPIRTANQAVQIEFNTWNSNNALNTDMTRMYLRDENNLLIYGNIEHGDLLDGNFHHFLVTADAFAANISDKIKAYIDGVAVPVTVAQSSAGAPSTFGDFTVDATFAARNVRGTVGLEANITLDEAALYGNTVLTAEQAFANASAAGLAVPEPASLSLLSMAAVGLMRRRRRPA